MTENSDYFKMLKRMIRAGAKRTGEADEIELAEFHDLLLFFGEQMKEAIHTQRDNGKSWTDIGEALNITRQAAHKKFK
jgi:hypothetical protein